MERDFSAGVWAIVHPDNSAGKTSLLEFLVWPLRGEPRDLPLDVRSWVRRLSMDVAVAGRPIRIVLDVDPGAHPALTGRILTADTLEQLLATEDGGDGLRLLEQASGTDEVDRSIGAFFLDGLRMGHTSLRQASGGADGEGAPQVRGWASYFGACYLNPGGDEILLGDVNAVGLSARLMEAFVDIPYSTVLTQLSVADKRERKTLAQGKRRAQGDADARKAERTAWQEQLEQLSQHIAELRDAASRDVSPLLQAADQAAARLRDTQSVLHEAEQSLTDMNAARVRADQALLDARETWQARRVLGRLDPVCCPRCAEPLDRDRRQQEREDASCAVCTRPLPEVDEETAEVLLQDLEQQLESAREAEDSASRQRDAAAAAVNAALAEKQAAAAALQEALATSQNHERLRQLELQAAGLEGRLAATAPGRKSRPFPWSAQVRADHGVRHPSAGQRTAGRPDRRPGARADRRGRGLRLLGRGPVEVAGVEHWRRGDVLTWLAARPGPGSSPGRPVGRRDSAPRGSITSRAAQLLEREPAITAAAARPNSASPPIPRSGHSPMPAPTACTGYCRRSGALRPRRSATGWATPSGQPDAPSRPPDSRSPQSGGRPQQHPVPWEGELAALQASRRPDVWPPKAIITPRPDAVSTVLAVYERFPARTPCTSRGVGSHRLLRIRTVTPQRACRTAESPTGPTAW
ncbi:hypothetical protein [Streptomyces sp. NPDC051636]|uniref:hypothetical protein n=1 Tax=Streptomyces sp. NPDC051636 TaxID=3365663 RepID=UPI0037B33B21